MCRGYEWRLASCADPAKDVEDSRDERASSGKPRSKHQTGVDVGEFEKSKLPVTFEEWATHPRPKPLDADALELWLAAQGRCKPCPFCGTSRTLVSSELNAQTNIYITHIACSNFKCFVVVAGNSRYSRLQAQQEAFNKWQRRPAGVTETGDNNPPLKQLP